MNIIKKDDILYFYESYWRDNKKNEDDRDSFGRPFPYPEENKNMWSGQQQFIEQLKNKEDQLKLIDTNRIKDCLICHKKNVNKGKFIDAEFVWEDGLKHYIEVHNIKPSDEFIEFVYTHNIKNDKTSVNRIVKFDSDVYIVHNVRHLKITRNQIMIMDALMTHGGYTKKYIDKKKKNVFRYSEHSGLLDFNKNGLDKIIISGKTERVDRGDEEIYLPKNIPDAIDYEYMFHTHPPTPKAGGRADEGILYDFPSISDIFHFMDHFNKGITQGSLVLSSEGMYNIRKKTFDRKKIKIDEDRMYGELQDLYPEIQEEAINEYGTDFNAEYFYKEISQNQKYINKINKTLNKYNIQIDYYPRSKDSLGKWIINDLFLPIYVTEQKK